MTDKTGKVLNVFPAIIQRNSRRVCTCENPVYLLDEKNHLVQCQECGAYLDPWTVLMDLAERWEAIEALERKSRERAEVWNEQTRKAMRFRGVANITREYQREMFPVCPLCEQPFDPSTVRHFVRRPPEKKVP